MIYFQRNLVALLEIYHTMARMQMLTDNELLAKIDEFLASQDMKPSRFGLEAMGDGALVAQLRAGRSLTLKNAARVMSFMAEYSTQPRKSA